MIGNILFVVMIIFQLSGGLILLIGNMQVDNTNENIDIIYGSIEKVNDVAFNTTFNKYKTAYSNATAGLFLIIGYSAAIGARLTWDIKIIFVTIIILSSLLVSLISHKIIVLISKMKAKNNPEIKDGTIWIEE